MKLPKNHIDSDRLKEIANKVDEFFHSPTFKGRDLEEDASTLFEELKESKFLKNDFEMFFIGFTFYYKAEEHGHRHHSGISIQVGVLDLSMLGKKVHES